MRYLIQHTTTYTYSQAVFLKSHTLRLRPRSNGQQQVYHCRISVQPPPLSLAELVDVEGNGVTQVWFPDQATDHLTVTTETEVETFCTNPFNYLIEPWAIRVPIDYPTSLAAYLHPYLQGNHWPAVDTGVVRLAQNTLMDVEGNVSFFLTTLMDKIYRTCKYVVRPTGAPWPSGLTWEKQEGSCRDFTLLFMDACRSVGLAARFVSGYHEGDPDNPDQDLHAWPEVYLPGGGWRGFDPTYGLAVTDQHIALAAGATPAYAAPVSGTLREGNPVQAILHSAITLERV